MYYVYTIFKTMMKNLMYIVYIFTHSFICTVLKIEATEMGNMHSYIITWN